MSEDMRADCSV